MATNNGINNTLTNPVINDNSSISWQATAGTVAWLTQVGATLIQSTTIITSTASLIVTNLSAYKEVWFYINAMVPATDGAYPILNVSYNNGSTWDTSANYNSQRVAFSGSTTTTANAGGQTSFNPAATIGMDNGTFSPCGYVYFGGLQWPQRKPIQSSFMFYDASLSLFMTLCNGEINTVNAINAIRLQMNTGNINNLNVDIYGMK